MKDEDEPRAGQFLLESELQDAIEEAIQRLPETQRMALVLRRYQQLSYEQIAEVLDLSVPAVKSVCSGHAQNSVPASANISISRHLVSLAFLVLEHSTSHAARLRVIVKTCTRPSLPRKNALKIQLTKLITIAPQNALQKLST